MAVSADTEYPTGAARQGEAAESDSVLRAKYADFCSAQLTEVFLSLSDERIYQLVEEEARIQDVDGGELGFRAMVKLATKRLRDSVPLPDFETWKRDYEAEPERYEKYLLGLWEPLVEGSGRGVPDGEG
ncbi:MAG: hypothetical protein R3195_09915 [Gemmatimonadota bacterium]|nr:hypothetical protein [Gemmatimonadota bacterium]